MRFDLFGRTFYFLSNERQISKAIGMLESYILKPEVLVLLVLLVIYIVAFIFAIFCKNEKLSKWLKLILPWVYLIIIIGVTFLNRVAGEREIRLYHDKWFSQVGFHESNVLGFLFNIALYIPYGFLVFSRIRVKKCMFSVIIVISTSFIIEVLQYVFARGVTAIDDLLANTLGGIIGIVIAIIIQSINRKRNKLE